MRRRLVFEFTARSDELATAVYDWLCHAIELDLDTEYEELDVKVTLETWREAK